jgi:3-isopropylmalate/(R)-2-methylmalate dehydratase small subunit
MEMIFEGTAHKFGRDVDTDVIIPARYLNTTDAGELAGHCMEDIDPDFIKRVKPGDIIVAEENFGCGSSREQAPVAIKAAGVACIVAASFARIFYRNAINIGLPILVSPAAARETDNGDLLKVDLEKGQITNLTKQKEYQADRFPDFMQEIIEAGGLMNYVKAKRAAS